MVNGCTSLQILEGNTMYEMFYNFARENSYLVLGIIGLIGLVIIFGFFYGLASYLEKEGEKEKNDHK